VCVCVCVCVEYRHANAHSVVVLGLQGYSQDRHEESH